jgi:DNA-directed RNA polymerase sigma subunit (sigma70/sigma32)
MDNPEGKPETNDQIGKRYGVSRETIRTRIKEILKNLRELLT